MASERPLVERAGIASAVASGVAVALRLGVEGADGVVWRLVAAAALAFLATVPLHRWTGDPRVAGGWLTGAGATAILAILAVQGPDSDAAVWLAFVPMVCARFVGPRAAVGAGVALAVGVGGLLLLHPADDASLLRVASLQVAVVFGGVLAWLAESARLAAEGRLADGRARLQAILDGLPDHVLLVAGDGSVRAASSERAQVAPALAAAAAAVADEVRFDQRRRSRDLQVGPPEEAQVLELVALPHEGGEVLVIARDVTERARLVTLQRRFVAMVSHELRTPLTSLRGALGMLAVDPAGAHAPELVDIADRNARRLARLVDDLLDLRRLEVGAVELDLTPLPLADLLARSLEEDAPLAARRHVRLDLDVDPGVHVHADAARTQQIVANLLSNAVRHSPPGGVVRVAVVPRGEEVHLTIEDEGPGVPAAFRARLFEPFTQAQPQRQRGGGAGLGLHISRTLARAMGGELSLDDREGGARLRLVLRRAAPPAPAG